MAEGLPATLSAVLARIRELLAVNPVLEAKKLVEPEAEWIISSCFRTITGQRLPRSELYLQPLMPYPEECARMAFSVARARSQGRLLQHLLGEQTFLDHDYQVGPDVLVPRPETEVLVSIAIEELTRRFRSPRFGVEIGIGSGIISVELLCRFGGLRMIASEWKDNAARRAGSNAARILGSEATRLHIVRPEDAMEVMQPIERNMLELRETADFLISNPPYLMENDEVDLEVRRYEPKEALFAPVGDPLFFYREIACKAPAVLREDGVVFVELAAERAPAICGEFERAGWKTRVHQDLNGLARVLVAVRQTGK